MIFNEEEIEACASKKHLKDGGDECKRLYDKHLSYFGEKRDASKKKERYQSFLSNVQYIHEHNTHHKEKGYRVSLNRFSDSLEHESPFFHDTMLDHDYTSLFDDIGSDLIKIVHAEDVLDSLFQKKKRKSQPKHDGKKKKNRKNKKGTKHQLTLNSSPESFFKKKVKKHLYTLKNSDKSLHLNGTHQFINSTFSSHLNWATEDNPDGIPLVHDAIDQGECGSCYAIASTGSMETISSRKTALEVYNSIMLKSVGSDTLGEMEKRAIEIAQNVERRAIEFARLSFQELIDCDTEFNQGCLGGNPILAFPFIKQNGLVSNDRYPYTEEKDQCKLKLIQDPIATADSWGILQPKNEDNMEHVLRYIGPISVGFNGDDKGFMHYKDGIFNSLKCSKRPNHALLVVGFGEVESKKGIEKYWIARNSWGKDWGMDGYIHIARGVGKKKSKKKKTSGVCGIAKNPSVALGAKLLVSKEQIDSWVQANTVNNVRESRNNAPSSTSKTLYPSVPAPIATKEILTTPLPQTSQPEKTLAPSPTGTVLWNHTQSIGKDVAPHPRAPSYTDGILLNSTNSTIDQGSENKVVLTAQKSTMAQDEHDRHIISSSNISFVYILAAMLIIYSILLLAHLTRYRENSNQRDRGNIESLHTNLDASDNDNGCVQSDTSSPLGHIQVKITRSNEDGTITDSLETIHFLNVKQYLYGSIDE